MNRIFHVVFISIIGLFLFANTAVFADGHCGIPVDSDGNTIPSPVGNIPFMRMPNALCADHGEYTWDYSGTVDSGNQSFSLEAGLVQFARVGSSGIGMQSMNFAFQQKGAWFYSNSTYGGENQISQAIAESINTVQSSASLSQFSVIAKTILDPTSQWTITSVSPQTIAPLYKGYVGQPGAEYQLTATGKTFLWRYDTKTGAATVAPYTYTVNVTMEDKLGATMEGLGGGYVGPQLVPQVSSSKNYNVEAEIAQPRLRVLNWSVQMQAIGSTSSGYDAHYQFSGSNGMMWNDFGPLDKGHSPISISGESQAKSQMLTTLVQQVVPEAMTNNVTVKNIKGLYNGNWLPVQFTQGKYAGATVVFSVFWRSAAQYVPGLSTDNMANSNFGWANFFGGVIPGQQDSAFSLLSTLYPENPGLPSSTTTQKPPYKIEFKKYVSSKYGLAANWVQDITITIKANTALRYALAMYADRLAHSTTADNPNKPIVIHVKAISPITQNTLFSSGITQYYEGAAIPTINGNRVGYAWIEHMRDQ